VGTPAYLAPEGPKDARSDLYSLGIIGYELMTGAVPFKGTTYQEIVIAHIREAPDLSVLPPDAQPLIAWLLAKDPSDRPQRASALLPVLYGAEKVPEGTRAGAPAAPTALPPHPALPEAPGSVQGATTPAPTGAAPTPPQNTALMPTQVLSTQVVPTQVMRTTVMARPATPPPQPGPAATNAVRRNVNSTIGVLIAMGLVVAIGAAALAGGWLGGFGAIHRSSMIAHDCT